MLLLIQYRLIKVGYAPALRYVIVKLGSKLSGRLLGYGISPGTEGNKELSVFVKSEISVHHCRKTDGRKARKLYSVLIINIFFKICIAIPETVPYIVHGIGPDTVLISVFPAVSARSDGLPFLVNQHRLYPGGAKLNA